MLTKSQLIQCHDCGLLQRIDHQPEEGAALCCRCSAVLRKRQRVAPQRSLEYALAMVVTGIVLFIVANSFPIVTIQVAGQQTATTLLGCAVFLFEHDMVVLSVLVFITSFAAPLLQLSGLLTILLPLFIVNRQIRGALPIFKFIRWVAIWSMLEVLMLGIIVSLVKLSAMVTVMPGIALWTFAGLIFIMAAITSGLDSEAIWQEIGAAEPLAANKIISPKSDLIACHICDYLNVSDPDLLAATPACKRCGANLHYRKPDSLNRCTAYLIAAIILYIPANIYPVMIISSLGGSEGDTILSGVIYLAMSGDWPLALIVFVASIFVPCLKLFILSLLIFSVQIKTNLSPIGRTRLYRLTELIGRWSMVDIYVATLMATLIQMHGLMEIDVGMGAFAFGLVVVLTMFSALSFDPRLIWDNYEDE